MADGSKTEKATPKKRRDERKRGNVAMSKDLVSVATLLGAYAVLRIAFGGAIESLSGFFQTSFAAVAQGQTAKEAISQLSTSGILTGAKIVGLLAAGIIVLAVAATFAQTGMLVSAESIKPKLNRISPIQGFKRMFSLRSLVETLKGILKIGLLLYVIYAAIRDMLSESYKYLYVDLGSAITHLCDAIAALLLRIIVIFAVIAVADYFYQWWEYEKQLRMSKQEVKEEYKQLEGDPQIKGKIKEAQRKMSQRRMMQQVPEADVVIRNPTHFAVALRYRPEHDNAPTVVAMGQDELALRIVSVAEENHVAVIENVPLARALYASTELGAEIPAEFYGAVAEILVQIFKLNGDRRIEESTGPIR